MARLRYNGLTATIGGSGLTNSATSVTFAAALTHSGGTAVPTITGSDYIPLTILDSSGNVSEIVSLTAYTSGATTGTISRAQEGTTGVAHNSGDKVVHGPTRSDLFAASSITRTALAANTPISSTTYSDVPNLTRTLSVAGPADTFFVQVVLDIEQTASSSAYFSAKLSADGAFQASEVVYRSATGSGERTMITQNWLISGLAAGSRVVKLQAALTSASGTYTINSNHTNMVVMQIP